MRRRRRSALIVVSFVALVLIGWLYLSSTGREPVYQGRQLREWIQDSEAPDLATQRRADEAIRAMGTDAVPSLIRMMRTQDSPPKLWFERLAEKHDLIQIRPERASDEHESAAATCSILGPQARTAIPALTELLPEECGIVAASALVSTGPDGVRALSGALTGTNESVRYVAATALADIRLYLPRENPTPQQLATFDDEARIAVPALIKLLRNTADPVRGQAAVTLGVLRTDANLVVPALIATLQEDGSPADGGNAAKAALSLGRFHEEAAGAVPALVSALTNGSPQVRSAAARALKDIDPQAAARAGVR